MALGRPRVLILHLKSWTTETSQRSSTYTSQHSYPRPTQRCLDVPFLLWAGSLQLLVMPEFKDRLARKFLRRSSAQSSDSTSPETRRNVIPSPRAHPSVPQLQLGGKFSTGASSGLGNPVITADHPSSLPSNNIDILPKARNQAQERIAPTLVVQEATPDLEPAQPARPSPPSQPSAPPTPDRSRPASPSSHSTFSPGPGAISLSRTPDRSRPVDTPPTLQEESHDAAAQQDYFGPIATIPQKRMARRKVWIRRAGASPTLVQITDEDLVDDVRDMVLRKYGNSLGRTWDSPDVAIKIVPREQSHQERFLNPEEAICDLLDSYFPGGQHVEEALLVEVPRRRTPQPSPRSLYPPHAGQNGHNENDNHPMENEGDYFPPMPAASPHLPGEDRPSPHRTGPPHSISILETGQLPVLPSPLEKKSHLVGRPKAHRQQTSSPVLSASDRQLPNTFQQRPKHQSRISAPAPPPLPTPPVASEGPNKAMPVQISTPPLDRIGSPRPKQKKMKNKQSISEARNHEEANMDRRPSIAHPQILSLIEATVPPINVLIVEDNPINLRLLEMFTKRLKVRWSTAMNGRDAVMKWRGGGFHLVLMDIQLPIMSGLQATREIRRLERVNGIGVFAKGESEVDDPKAKDGVSRQDPVAAQHLGTDDNLIEDGNFKSPVIIVALTASSLQSDRHEALAAGCNDFLTKVCLFYFRHVAAFTDDYHSLCIFHGSSVRSWSGAACKPSSILTAGEDGRLLLQLLRRSSRRKKI